MRRFQSQEASHLKSPSDDGETAWPKVVTHRSIRADIAGRSAIGARYQRDGSLGVPQAQLKSPVARRTDSDATNRPEKFRDAKRVRFP
jgi:hypothetical protein